MKKLLLLFLVFNTYQVQAGDILTRFERALTTDEKDLTRIKETIAEMKRAGLLNEPLPIPGRSTALAFALKKYPPAVWPLIQAGSDVNTEIYCGEVPIFQTQKLALIQMLIKAGAKVDVKNNCKATPLHFAKTRRVASALIRAGAPLDVEDCNGTTPFTSKIRENKIGIVKLMLTVEPELIHKKSVFNGMFPLHFANTREMAQLLLDAGANPHATNYLKRTPLHSIHEYTNKGVVKALAPKSTLESCDNEGNTPLHYAAVSAGKKWQHAKILIDAGAKVSARVKGDCRPGDTPLHIAALTGSIGVARLLLKYTRAAKPCVQSEPLAAKETKES